MKFLLATAAVIWLAGCANDNKITIVNNAQEDIMFNFRATVTTVAAGTTAPITNIPNGSYEYNTTYGVPAEATSWSVSGAAGGGSLSFDLNQTHHLLIYSSRLSAGAYTLYVNATSSDSTGSSSTTPSQ
jgi:hypothetical protein